MPNFLSYQWTDTEPRGEYVLFYLATKAGALASGAATDDDVMGLATDRFAVP
jgi:hypothetical protein